MACPAGYTFEQRKPAPFAAMTETIKPGERFVYWDYDIMWTEKHFAASKLEPLRQTGDVLADDAMAALDIKAGQDAYQELLAYTARPAEEQTSAAPKKLMDQLMTVPEWVDWEQIQRGQQVYWRYALFISHALLHFSLAGGFSVPKITKVLNSTGYLAGKKTKERVLETSQFILDVVHSPEYLQPGTGVAWESIIQVRFLHASVRTRLARISRAHSATKGSKYYNIEEHGVPINQEDLLATLFSFSTVMWRVMETRMGVVMTTQEREDYLHLWRYIGYMMGVVDVLGATTSPERSDACLESIVLHISDPDEESGKMCASLLKNMAPPVSSVVTAIGLPDPFKVHMALAEHLLGAEFWKVNKLPHMTRPYRFMKELFLYFMYFDLWLITKSPWWFRVRSPLLREGQYRMIAGNIGRSRTQFELRALPKDNGDAYDGDLSESGRRGKVWPRVLTAASAAVGVALVLAQRA